MGDLLRAEWSKMFRHSLLTSALVWIYPIGAAALYGIGLLVVGIMVGDELEPTRWTADLPGIWGMINVFPGNVFGRLLPIAYMAIWFAGEYQWGTWKNLLPRRSRPALILSKIVALIGMISFSLFLASLVIFSIQWLRHGLAGVAYQPALDVDSIRLLLKNYLWAAGSAAVTMWSLAAIAAVMAVLTRSVLGAMLLSFALSIGESISMLLLILIGNFIGKPELVNLYQYMPSYNLENLRLWIMEGIAFTAMPPEFTSQFSAEPTWWLSAIFLVLWTLVWTGLAIWLFQRQDVSS